MGGSRSSVDAGVCPDDNDFAALVEGRLDAERLDALERHLVGCSRCADLAAQLGRELGGGRTPYRGGEVFPGDSLGRYRVVDWLGRGAMGQVYRAHDPSLGREVALKVVLEPLGEQVEARLAREARAMAQLSSHPNVVTVYDVGKAAGRTFIAMERVEGTALDRALQRDPRSWRDIVALFIEAGRGLAAAHAAGIVHRDFKPSNVLVGDDGRVKVGDFGLATAMAAPDARADEQRATSWAGTPAYMAPEQHVGQAADAASDQFSFAVALWEALHGSRPFAGETASEIRKALLLGERREVVRSKVPAALRRALEPALSLDPGERYPSLDELLVRLEALMRRRRRRQLAAAAALAAIVAGAWAAGAVTTRPELCPPASDELARAWNDDLRERIAATLGAVPRPYAERTSRAVVDELDAYAARWLDAHRDVCRATHVRHEQSEPLLDARMACLDHHLSDFGALAAMLGRDASLLDGALPAVGGLAPVSECQTLAIEGGALPEPTTEASRRAQALASRARAQILLGRLSEAMDEIELGLEAIGDDGSVALRGRLELLRGVAHSERFEPEVAEAALKTAAELAARARDSRTVAEAWTVLSYVVGVQRERYREGLTWAHAARRELERLGQESGLLTSRLDQFEGAIYRGLGDMEKAAEHFEAALDRARDAREDRPLVYALTALDAGIHWQSVGRLPRARQLIEESFEIRRRELGASHPVTAQARAQLGDVLRAMGDPRGALELGLRAFEDLEAALGAGHPVAQAVDRQLVLTYLQLGEVSEAASRIERMGPPGDGGDEAAARDLAQYHSLIGDVRLRQARFDDAVDAFRTAALHWKAHHGGDHPAVVDQRTKLGTALRLAGRLDEAAAELRAVASYYEAHAPAHPGLIPVLHYLAEIAVERGDCAAAQPLIRRSITLIEESVGAEHRHLSFPLILQATCARRQRSYAVARQALERALGLRQATSSTPTDVAEIHFEMARVDWAAGRRKEARRAARAVLDQIAGAEDGAALRAQVTAWLDDPR